MINTRRIIITFIIILLLLIPLISMQFTNEVNWDFFDFAIAAFLLLGSGMVIDLIFDRVKSKKYRVTLSVLVIGVLILIWIELAVGLFGL